MIFMSGCSTEGCEAIATPQSAIIVQRGNEIMLACRAHLLDTDTILQAGALTPAERGGVLRCLKTCPSA